MPTESANLQRANEALNLIDEATTKAGTAVTAIQARIDDLLNQIAASDTLEEARALADRAHNAAAPLATIADALTAMGQVADPVPDPIPDPEPDPEA